MYRILHIFLDEKFFDGTASFFDMIPNVKNYYYLYTPIENYRFKFIRDDYKVHLVSNKKDYYKILKSNIYDIVYLHSLSPVFYDYVLRLNKKAKVIWWSWGYDIYSPLRACKPILDLDLYKKETKNYKNRKKHINDRFYIVRWIYYCFTFIFDLIKRKRAISRVDYFTPVLSLEFDMVRDKCGYFNAKPFMIKCAPTRANLFSCNSFKNPGNILVGNSLTYTNNHLDVFKILSPCLREENQKFIIPINYGTDIDKSYLKTRFDLPNVWWLEDYMPKDEYFMVLDTVTHAVFGAMRQQAMGNIFYCLGHGVKVYLYADSIIYKYLVNQGYVVYSIENITETSFQIPLDYESAKINCTLLNDRRRDNINYAFSEIDRIMSELNC